ncbi:MAG: hypothetical protein QXV66_00740 [Candidatus Rehaiarchaeum fermentans]|nr:hypothetical protein [Candidatus Rehaiarchaeum fermentans]
MKCSLCNEDSYFYSTYLKQWLCKKHFAKMIERRIRRNILNNKFKSKDGYEILKSTPAYKVLEKLFNKKGGIKLDSYILEDFALEVMKYFLNGENPVIKISKEDYFNPLYNVSLEELEAYCKLKNIELNIQYNDKILDFLNSMEKRRPGSKISVVESGRILGII